MSATGVSDPVRTCIGCRRRQASRDLVRVTCVDGDVVVDGASAGRGAWLCRHGASVAPTCLEQALARRAFGRAWRVELTVDIEQALRELGRGHAPDV